MDLLLRLYRLMYTARRIDLREQQIARRGQAGFQLSGCGHEGSVALADHLIPQDWLHPHYRSRALLLARGIPPQQFFDNLLGNRRSDSQGRRMGAFFQDPERRILSMVTPVGNNALQAVGVAETLRDSPEGEIVVCGLGDGTTQQGEFLEACGHAARQRLPVLFLIEDNHWAISTSTRGQTFYDLPDGTAAQAFWGIPIERIDGRDVLSAHERLGKIVQHMRASREPMCVVLDVERLVSHTSADDHKIYRSAQELDQIDQTADPVQLARAQLLHNGMQPDVLEQIETQIDGQLAEAEIRALACGPPTVETSAKRTLPAELTHPAQEHRSEGEPQLTMRESITRILSERLANDGRVVLLGEDIEDPKGDVFGVTRGLSSRFPGRVLNAPLSESTIIGTSIGRALAGQRPVAFVQFADFLPLSHNQLTSELATLYWRTAGRWSAPVIVMAACGGYRPGLGPYHAQTADGTYVHVPGLDVLMPSTAIDAAGLLRAAFASERPTLFLYPKALLNDQATLAPADLRPVRIPIGPARKARMGRDITLVAWGNTVPICQQVATHLEQAGVDAELLDLRSLSPWDEQSVIASAEKTARLLVVHEDNRTGGLGAEVLATVAERARVPVASRRVVRNDTHLPYHFGNQQELLPSVRTVLETAAELLDLDVQWQEPKKLAAGKLAVPAVGSAPSDDHVQVVQWLVRPGETVQIGAPLATVEASKSVFEMTSPHDGTVDQLLVDEGESVPVGEPVVILDAQGCQTHVDAAPGLFRPGQTPILRAKPRSGRIVLRRDSGQPRQFDVGMSSIATIEGSREVANEELIHGGEHTSQEIVRLTGIERRHWVGDGQDAVSMAASASRKVLEREGLLLDDVDLLICSTTSPLSVTPSMACRVLHELAASKGGAMMQAFDVNAACSGYLYALQAAYDYLQSRPDGRVLVITTEVLSPLLDLSDFDTAILFGDAASATVLYGENHFEQATARLQRPELSAKGDAGETLSVPLLNDGFIQMQGRKVFTEAVRMMVSSLTRACHQRDINVDQLDLIVPHQANQRIIDAVQHRIHPPVYSNIRYHGNTSSSSIPLCLSELLPSLPASSRVGLCAFGGGFTFGAGILELE